MSYYHDGREYRESTGTAEEKQARKVLRLRLQDVANDHRGIQPFLGPGANRVRINNLLDELAQDYRVRGKLSPSITSYLEGELWEIVQRRWSARVITRKNGTTSMPRYVFHRDGYPIGEFKKSWATACTAAGVGHKLFHDFRRAAVRNMVRAGVPGIGRDEDQRAPHPRRLRPVQHHRRARPSRRDDEHAGIPY